MSRSPDSRPRAAPGRPQHQALRCPPRPARLSSRRTLPGRMRPGLDLPWPSVMVPPSAAQPTLDSTGAQPSKLFVRELADGARVESAFVVRDVARRSKKNGDSFLKLQLGDVTGAVEAVVWDGVDAAAEAAAPGAGVFAPGAFSVDSRYGASVTPRSLRPAPCGGKHPADLHHRPPKACELMGAALRE